MSSQELPQLFRNYLARCFTTSRSINLIDPKTLSNWKKQKQRLSSWRLPSTSTRSDYMRTSLELWWEESIGGVMRRYLINADSNYIFSMKREKQKSILHLNFRSKCFILLRFFEPPQIQSFRNCHHSFLHLFLIFPSNYWFSSQKSCKEISFLILLLLFSFQHSSRSLHASGFLLKNKQNSSL